MKDIIYTRAKTREELIQIRTLQFQNISTSITSEEKLQEGFVTVQHSLELLEQMNTACAHIIAREDQKVVGYALVMLPKFKNEIKILIPMFDRIDALLPINKSYVIMGQICVDKNYRRQGIFRQLYLYYKGELQKQFDFLITEVAAINHRSINAHLSVGFKTIEIYEDKGILWHIMLWDWE